MQSLLQALFAAVTVVTGIALSAPAALAVEVPAAAPVMARLSEHKHRLLPGAILAVLLTHSLVVRSRVVSPGDDAAARAPFAIRSRARVGRCGGADYAC